MKPTRDGETKDHLGVRWVAHCGAWWSDRVWRNVDAIHRRSIAGSCGECRVHIVTNAERAITAAEAAAGAFDRKVRDAHPGYWEQFYPLEGAEAAIPPGGTQRVETRVTEPLIASHLGFDAASLGKFMIEAMWTARIPMINGPFSADHFVVRVPDDVQIPIDRGGSLAEPVVLLFSLQAMMTLRNVSAEPIVPRCALLCHPPPKDWTFGGTMPDYNE